MVEIAAGSPERGVAVVTGAARGLGAAIARELAVRGMNLVLADRDEAGLAATARELSALGAGATCIPTDVGDPNSIEALVRIVDERFGAVAILVNNAGVELVGKVWELSAAELERIVRVNLLGAMQVVRGFAPAMIAAGNPARIVNVASLGALGAMPLQTAYILTKQALLSYSEGLALELRQFAPHVSVSVVLPGSVDTGIFDRSDREGADSAAFRSILRTMLESEGLSPVDAAKVIMAQIDEGRFWITSHPEQLASLAQQRAACLSVLAEPKLDEAGVLLMARLGHETHNC